MSAITLTVARAFSALYTAAHCDVTAWLHVTSHSGKAAICRRSVIDGLTFYFLFIFIPTKPERWIAAIAPMDRQEANMSVLFYFEIFLSDRRHSARDSRSWRSHALTSIFSCSEKSTRSKDDTDNRQDRAGFIYVYMKYSLSFQMSILLRS